MQLLNTPLLPTLHFAKVTQWVGNAGDELWKTTRLTRIGAALFCCFPKGQLISKGLFDVIVSTQGIPIVTLYSYLSILVGKISTVFLQNLEYLLTDQG